MERLLVVVEEQMEYLKSKEINKDMSTYDKFKEQLDKLYKDLCSILKETSVKVSKLL